jgi:hypothetical protein
LAQNSLGVLYQEIGQLAIAVEYYRLAAAQGVADAQYNLALLRHPDFVQMRPRLEEAAAQGHAEARFHLALGLQRLHDAAAVRFAHGLINNANQENFVHQGDQHIPERGIENEVIRHFENVIRPRHDRILQKNFNAVLVRRPDILICPISLSLMRDPVTLMQSGHTFDRESLCQWLLINPTRCPFTNVDYGVKLQYGDNIKIRQLLTLYYGDQAYQRYDDATFYIRYEAMWNEDMYENISAYLYGMNSEWLDWTSLQRTLMIDYQEDPVAMGFKSLLLHPNFVISARIRKNENEDLREWERAEQLDLTVLVDAGNPWAQWLQGMHKDIIEDDTEAARLLFQLAANQWLALAQFSLGAILNKKIVISTRPSLTPWKQQHKVMPKLVTALQCFMTKQIFTL